MPHAKLLLPRASLIISVRCRRAWLVECLVRNPNCCLYMQLCIDRKGYNLEFKLVSQIILLMFDKREIGL